MCKCHFKLESENQFLAARVREKQMAKRSTTVPFMTITLSMESGAALYRQLYDELREAILSGRLIAGARLPSTRDLASELKVSRNTVINAFEQLLAEGYVEGHVGAGTYVSRALPDEMLHARGDAKRRTPKEAARAERRLSRRGEMLAATSVSIARDLEKLRPFRGGTPALEEFPFDLWGRLFARRLRNPQRELLNYGSPAGYRPLREAIAAYLGTARAVRCTADQVIVVSGAQQALDIAARVLLDRHDPAWIEDPGYLGARGALQGAGARLVPVPVDDNGLNVQMGATLCPDARVVYVSPSHQYPLGVTMSLARRLSLLEWVSRTGAWILEDDYDSEYRYAGRPLAALQGLDNEGRVIYIGTFSKVLFPSQRLGYMVVPLDMVDAFVAARALADRHSPSLDQAVLTDFINEGHFARHIRRMRALYAERQHYLIKELQRHLPDLIEVHTDEAGMHLVGWLPEGVDDRAVSQEAAKRGIEAQALSFYRINPSKRGALVLGYAAFTQREIRDGVRKMAEAIHAVVGS